MNSPKEDPALLLTVQQAADALAVSAPTVDRWIADGSLPIQHTRTGSVRIRPEDVLKLRRTEIWVTPFADKIWPTEAQ